MKAEIIKWRKNELGYEHVVCNCKSNSFHVATIEKDGVPCFGYLVCDNCENTINVDLKPVWAEQC